MSSTYPSSNPSSRTWWSLGPKQGLQRQSSDKSSRSSGLSSIAVALGLKSKKHPVLTIQDPAYPSSRPPMPTIVTKSVNRPHSKSVSSTRSRVDSVGPRTPLDPQREGRQSLLTISDADPFAVRAISSAPHTPSDPNRLSVYSNSSSPDFMSKSFEPILNRVSYGSSSSHSNTHGSDLSPLSPNMPDSSIKNIKLKKSTGSLHRKQSLMSGDQSLGTAWESLSRANKSAIAKAGSSTTLTPEKNRLSQPEATPTPRPPMRARGMTDSGAVQRPEFLPSSTTTVPSSSHTASGPSPRVIIRQPSVSRIGLPPSAPPRQELPPPPPLVGSHTTKDEDLERMVPISTSSASSSSLSFASSVSSQRDMLYHQSYSPRQKMERSLSSRAGVSQGLAPSQAPHTLKKAVSHQSLGRRPPPSTSSVPVPLPDLPAPSKAPRKQRSFHQPKFPLPPLSPLRPSNSVSAQASSLHVDSQSAVEPKKSSAGGVSMPGRKRLFSGSSIRRPSTSQTAVPEDDNQSVFSVRSVPDQSMGTSLFNPTTQPIIQPISPTLNSSFWDERSLLDHMPASPRTVTHEYTPQQIMTPAELAKLEASVDDASASGRQRVLSNSTMVSVLSDGDIEALSPAGSLIGTVGNKMMTRSTSLVQKGLSTPPHVSMRPSTSQVNMTSSIMSEQGSPISSPSSPSMTSLPPPPRRPRPRATQVQDDPILPSLPPPPGRKYLRQKISVEKALHRRSIMKKPSFLEISDDDTDEDTDSDSLGEPPSGSFLDLARESFDTTRSMDE